MIRLAIVFVIGVVLGLSGWFSSKRPQLNSVYSETDGAGNAQK